MLITYQGPHPEVVVDELDQDTVIKANVPTEIPDELAARLLNQDTWAKAETPDEQAAREKRDQDEAAAIAAAKADADAQAKVAADNANAGTPAATVDSSGTPADNTNSADAGKASN